MRTFSLVALAVLAPLLALAGNAKPGAAPALEPKAAACAKRITAAKDAVLAGVRSTPANPVPKAWVDLVAACTECAPQLSAQTPRSKLVCETARAIEAELPAGKAGLRGKGDCDNQICSAWSSELSKRLEQTLKPCDDEICA